MAEFLTDSAIAAGLDKRELYAPDLISLKAHAGRLIVPGGIQAPEWTRANAATHNDVRPADNQLDITRIIKHREAARARLLGGAGLAPVHAEFVIDEAALHTRKYGPVAIRDTVKLLIELAEDGPQELRVYIMPTVTNRDFADRGVGYDDYYITTYASKPHPVIDTQDGWVPVPQQNPQYDTLLWAHPSNVEASYDTRSNDGQTLLNERLAHWKSEMGR